MDERQRLAAIAYIRSIWEDPGADTDERNAELFALYQHMREVEPGAPALFRDAIGPHWTVPWETLLRATGQNVPDLERLDFGWFIDYEAYREALIEEFAAYFDVDEYERAEEVVDDLLGVSVFLDPVVRIEWEPTVDALFEALEMFVSMGPQNITAMASHEIPHLDVMQDEYAERVEGALRRYRDAMLEAGVEPAELQELHAALDLYGAESLITKSEMASVGLGFLADGIVMDLSEKMLEPDMRGAIEHETDSGQGTVSIWLGPGFAALFQEAMAGYDFGAMTDQQAFWEFDLDDVIQALRWAPEIFGTRVPQVEVTAESPERWKVVREALRGAYEQGLYQNFDDPGRFLRDARRIGALPNPTTGSRWLQSQWWSRCNASMGVMRTDRRRYYRAPCPAPLTTGARSRRSRRNSMNAEEAYRYAMARLNELREAGVIIESIIPRSVREGGERLDELIAKYPPPERLPHHLWRHITLRPTSRKQVQLVRHVRDQLGRMGIGFDSGGVPGAGALDWEFDWSFHVDADTAQMEARRHAVDELIDNAG